MKSNCVLILFAATLNCWVKADSGSNGQIYNNDRFLTHIFNKYGSNGSSMSFEGLEHLLYSLGLGGFEFGPGHSLAEHRAEGFQLPELSPVDEWDLISNLNNTNESETSSGRQIAQNVDNKNVNNFEKLDELYKFSFKILHDPKHRHPRHHEPSNANRCLSPMSLMKLMIHTESTGTGQVANFNKLSYSNTVRRKRSSQSTNRNAEADDSNDELFINSVKITPDAFLRICPALLVQLEQEACVQPLIDEHLAWRESNISWLYASVAIFIISSCGLLGVGIVPLTKSAGYQETLKFLVAVAVGTLVGDALMHLLPHALKPHNHENAWGKNSGAHESNEAVWICASSFATFVLMYALETLLPLIKGSAEHSHHSHHHSHGDKNPAERSATPSGGAVAEVPIRTSPAEISVMLDDQNCDLKGSDVPLTPLAFMVVIGDGLHNLTDGLAIGAAFASDPVTGMATAFAVLCHELPHELGDFALLLKTGVKIRRAMYLNLVSSVLSFIGMAVGLLIAGMHEDLARWIYAGTAGSFLYIAIADLIPEMGRDGKHDTKNCLIQIGGILFGGIIMTIIAVNEDQIRWIFE